MSSRTTKSGEVARYVGRIGEGTPVDAQVRPVTTVSGRSAGLMTVNISTAPVPERRYVAEICSVVYENETVKIFFGQVKQNSTTLRTLLVVHMSPTAVRHFVATLEGVKNPSFQELAVENGFEEVKLSFISEEPEQTVAFAANFVLSAMSGREACLDFYQASAFAIGAVQQTSKLALDAVVRVDLRSSLALGMFNELTQLIKKFPQDAAWSLKP